MLYVFSVLTTPGEFIKQLNTITYKFLWKGTDKIATLAAVNGLEYGGLNLIDLETYVKSSRLEFLAEFLQKVRPHGKLTLIICLRILVGLFYSPVITMSKTVKLFPLFIENFLNGELT